MNADERIKKAMELRGSGYNCAQTVLMVFTDATGVDIDMSANIGASEPAWQPAKSAAWPTPWQCQKGSSFQTLPPTAN